MISQDVASELKISEAARRNSSTRTWVAFLLLGVLLYGAAYAAAEMIVHRYGDKSRLFMIATAPRQHYDVAILGASHAMPFDYGDMNQRLEAASGASVINLSMEGAGIVPAAFNLDYLLSRHSVNTVVYVLDSFQFYSREWNEDRLKDASLLKRAPFDVDLLRILWRYPATRKLVPGYASGFYKINDAERFKPDRAGKDGPPFEKVYRPNRVIDRLRVKYLYPSQVDLATEQSYLRKLDELAEKMEANRIEFIVIRPPLPERVLSRFEGEEEFNNRLRNLMRKHGFEVCDFSTVSNQDEFFFDTDHLNRAGASHFIDNYLAPILERARSSTACGAASATH